MTKFKVTKDNKEFDLRFADLTSKDVTEASKMYNRTFAELLEAGGLLRKKLATELKKQGLWSDDQQIKLEALQKSIVKKEHQLHKGGMKLTAAKDLALEIKTDRTEQAILLTAYNEYDNITVEGQADNARFNYLVYAATVYDKSGKKYFKSYDEFVSYKDPVATIAATKYAKEYYNLDENFESSLPENQFLQQFNFIDDQLRPLNKDGHLVDDEGNLVDENGDRVDSDGNRVDIYGYKRNEDGSFSDKASPFLDEKGKPVAVDSDADSQKTNAKDST